MLHEKGGGKGISRKGSERKKGKGREDKRKKKREDYVIIILKIEFFLCIHLFIFLPSPLILLFSSHVYKNIHHFYYYHYHSSLSNPSLKSLCTCLRPQLHPHSHLSFPPYFTHYHTARTHTLPPPACPPPRPLLPPPSLQTTPLRHFPRAPAYYE